MLAGNPKTQTEWLVGQLKSDILRGTLKPGDKLKLGALQERYDTGLSPLREALSRLSSLSLVMAEGQRGFSVAKVSATDLLDLVKTKIWVDGIGLRASIARGDRDWEADIIAAAHRLGINEKNKSDARVFEDQWEEQHRLFHLSLVSACDAPRLLGYRDLLWEYFDRYRRLSALYDVEGRDIDAEHRALVAAVLARDGDRAVALNGEHLLATTRVLLNSDPETCDRTASLIAELETNIRDGSLMLSASR